MKSIRSLSAGVLLAAALTSCTAPAKVSDEKDANGNKVEYVYYTPTGSSIPVKVRKDQLKATDQDAAAAEKLLSDADKLSNRGPPPDPASAH